MAAADSPADRAADSPAERRAGSPVGGVGQRPRVLVVDDDLDVRLLLDTTLERAGFEVFGRADGVTALTAALTLRPSLVVLDWMLPGGNGLEICTTLRSRPELSATGIIMITARRDHITLEAGVAAGADRFLAKPLVPRVVVQHAKELVAAYAEAG